MENKKLKIALFCDTFFPMVDGVINVVDSYARRLSKIADVCVFVAKSRDKSYVDKFPYKVVRCQKALKMPTLDYDLPLPEMDYKFLDAINEFNPDIIHIHSPFSIGQVGVNYAKQHNIPCVATCHSQFKQDFKEATKSDLLTAIAMGIIMPVFNACEECWTMNSQVANLFHNDYKLKRMPLIKRHGTEMEYYENEAKVKSLRKKLKIKDDEKVLLFVGRIHVLKNILFIADVLSQLKKDDFKFKMIFVGVGPDMDKLKDKIKELKLTRNVIFAGKILDRIELSKYYQLADLFVFPSYYDTDGLVKYEAASQFTPVITIKDTFCSSNITDGKNGYIANGNVKDFANRIIEIFNNKEEYSNVCQGCKSDLYITWDEAAKNTYEDYLDVIKKYNEGYYNRLKTYVKYKKSTKKKVVAKRKKRDKKIEQENKKLERVNKRANEIENKIKKLKAK